METKQKYKAITIPDIAHELEKENGIEKVFYSKEENEKMKEVRFNIFFHNLQILFSSIEKIDFNPKELHVNMEEQPFIATLIFRSLKK